MHADAWLRDKRYAEAEAAAQPLTRWRRLGHDWQLLAVAEKALGHPRQAVEALETATRIDNWRHEAREILATYYRQQGNLERAAWHQRRIVPEPR